jgi:hypothetical protein
MTSSIVCGPFESAKGTAWQTADGRVHVKLKSSEQVFAERPDCLSVPLDEVIARNRVEEYAGSVGVDTSDGFLGHSWD